MVFSPLLSEPHNRHGPELPEVADCRALGLTPGRALRTRVAGVFLFLPLLTKLGFDRLVTAAEYPGSAMVPARLRSFPCWR